jgi:excinuclease UvrABC ATPase subunit
MPIDNDVIWKAYPSYTHKFLGRLDTPKVEHIKGISPAIAIKQKVNTTNTRSTVGTEIKIYDYIKLLFAEWVELYRQFPDKKSKKGTFFENVPLITKIFLRLSYSFISFEVLIFPSISVFTI